MTGACGINVMSNTEFDAARSMPHPQDSPKYWQRWLEDRGVSAAPVASPDGRYVVFNRQKDNLSRIWRADADGKNAVQLTETDAQFADFNPQITADGRMVIFQRQVSGDDRVVLMRIPIEGGTSELFHSSETWSIFQPRISPDGPRWPTTTPCCSNTSATWR